MDSEYLNIEKLSANTTDYDFCRYRRIIFPLFKAKCFNIQYMLHLCKKKKLTNKCILIF